MDGIHGVDVSWLHHSNKDQLRAAGAAGAAAAAAAAAANPPSSQAHAAAVRDSAPATTHPFRHAEGEILAADAQNTAVSANNHDKDKDDSKTADDAAATAAATATPPKSINKRPSILNRNSQDKTGTMPPDARTLSRRGSWISNLSSKFSSSPGASNGAAANGSPNKGQTNGHSGSLPLVNPYSPGLGQPLPTPAQKREESESMEPYVPQPPESQRGSFLSNALRRLSSGSQAPPATKKPGNGGCVPRKVMNVDPNRERCLVPELDDSKLRRVAFCVDVEIAGTPRYKDDKESPERKKSKTKRLKERGEGEALKNPEAVVKEKEKDGIVAVSNEEVGSVETPNPEGTVLDEKKDAGNGSKKKEKKKRSEAERKERKEKKRRKAEENGSVPMELIRDDEDTSTPDSDQTRPSKPQDRPTTDPLRIYRRCCQLRESPILKRITEQLSDSSNCPIATPGAVNCLNLTGSRLTLADINTLGDWLAVVPVTKLLLEDADLTDEGVRVVLAGLLAAKLPEFRRRRNSCSESSERTGVVEKLSLKNNPRITREGWKHISLFIYMCRSLKALDVSNVFFPQPRVPPKVHPSEQKKQVKVPIDDVAEILCKSLSERLGGSHLEELLMANCALTANNVRKIVDGVVVSGIQRLGLSGNSLDDEGLEHVVRYLRSGVCHGLDLGGNDLCNRLARLCEGLNEKIPLWALGLADCNLSPDAIKPLFPRLVAMSNFRFIDLSHNHSLFAQDPSALGTLRKYMPQMRFLKRIHLEDVQMTPAQAIGLAEVLPECPQLAHLNILENPEISALASASDESSQEEACALYASLMVAVRVSDSIMCVDVDVPSPESSEVVKALAKQVVAHCLRNMERCTAQETGISDSTAAVSDVGDKNVELPDVLLHLVGHETDTDETNVSDDDGSSVAPDEDYIVGGTGLVKALNYCLLEKASDNLRRKTSLPGIGSRPGSGTATPRSSSRIGHRNSTSTSAKAKVMSKNLLTSARKIRARLQPALAREARASNDMAYKRLLFLDNTLQGIIQRFEAEYPECRPVSQPLNPQELSNRLANSLSSISSSSLRTDNDYATAPTSSTSTNAGDSVPSESLPAPASGLVNDAASAHTGGDSDMDDYLDEEYLPPLGLRSRHNSDVSLASRAQTLEEGRVHRMGQSVRRDVIRPGTPTLGLDDHDHRGHGHGHRFYGSRPGSPLLAAPGPEGRMALPLVERLKEWSGEESAVDDDDEDDVETPGVKTSQQSTDSSTTPTNLSAIKTASPPHPTYAPPSPPPPQDAPPVPPSSSHSSSAASFSSLSGSTSAADAPTMTNSATTTTTSAAASASTSTPSSLSSSHLPLPTYPTSTTPSQIFPPNNLTTTTATNPAPAAPLPLSIPNDDDLSPRPHEPRDAWERRIRAHFVGVNAEELRRMEQDRPAEWARFREAQIAALVNAGRVRWEDVKGEFDDL
ncbi:uncharacterized protein IWZ02DRAFT_484303 [Phyllosticta citriasiana]|uniref:uncharacterized protein n=1 Tax=Phyllosticta citriasiana TaxID=595635 RepID=UPI0030FD3DCA